MFELFDCLIVLMVGFIYYDILLLFDVEICVVFGFVVVDGVFFLYDNVEWFSVGWGSRVFYINIGGYSDLMLGIVWCVVIGDIFVVWFEFLGLLLLEYLELCEIKVF